MLELQVRYALLGRELELVEEVTLIFESGALSDVVEGWEGRGIRAEALAMPALVNSHIHLGDSAIPERWVDKSLSEIVDPKIGLKIKELEKLSKDEIIRSMAETLEKMMLWGTSVAADFREQGIKGVRMGLEASRRSMFKGYLPFGRFSSENGLLKLVELSHGLGLPEPDYPNEELARKGARLFNGLGKPVATHVAEVNGPEELFKAFELNPSFVIHGINLELEHFEEMRSRGVALAITPRANMWFGMEPKVDLALEAGVTLLLGTDNAAWTRPDLWRELEFTALLLRRRGKWNEEVAREILKAATVNAQEPLKVPWKIAIERGSRGPIILLDSKELDLDRTPNKYTAIVKRGSAHAIIGRIEGGRYFPKN